ncbi:MAG: hypothetical protein WKF92_03365 [Pyrinomonadaceae bacterium]
MENLRFAAYFKLLPILLLLSAFSFSPAFAQYEPPDDMAPPPVKNVSQAERSQLEAETEVKKRTKLALELMDLRLKKAEELNSRQEFTQMFLELGGFHGLVDNTLVFLTQVSRSDSGKVLNNFKRLEIGLRTFIPRMEIIRRELPARYEFYVRILTRYLRDARSKAIEPLFGDTVVPNRKS